MRHMLLSMTGRSCRCQPSRGFFSSFFSAKKGLSRALMAWVLRPIDFSFTGVIRWFEERGEKALVHSHRFLPERHETLGPDLATAHFVVARRGAVMFKGFNRWIVGQQVGKKFKYSLPSVPSSDLVLEAIDVSNTDMMYVSFDNFVMLSGLKYLSLAGCRFVDDWCMDRLVQFRDSLVVLDVSRCPLVTERGLAMLHRLPHLQRLRMYDMPAVKDKKLLALLLEEVLPAGCVIEGVDFNSAQEESAADSLPTFLKRYEELAFGAEREKQATVEEDRKLAGLHAGSPSKSEERDANSKLSTAEKIKIKS